MSSEISPPCLVQKEFGELLERTCTDRVPLLTPCKICGIKSKVMKRMNMPSRSTQGTGAFPAMEGSMVVTWSGLKTYCLIS